MEETTLSYEERVTAAEKTAWTDMQGLAVDPNLPMDLVIRVARGCNTRGLEDWKRNPCWILWNVANPLLRGQAEAAFDLIRRARPVSRYPLRRNLDYCSVGRRILLVSSIPEGTHQAVPPQEQDAEVGLDPSVVPEVVGLKVPEPAKSMEFVMAQVHSFMRNIMSPPDESGYPGTHGQGIEGHSQFEPEEPEGE